MQVVNYIAEYLKSIGINHVFGYQGGGISPLIDAISKTDGIDYVQLYQEQGAGFAADAYARCSQKLGVCLVTNGPGITNLVSSIANSQFDFSPCLFFSGQVNVSDINKTEGVRQNGFQEVDGVQLVKGITKYAVSIRNAEDIKNELEKAVKIAMEAPKGAVLIELPLNIQKTEIGDAHPLIKTSSREIRTVDVVPFIKELKKAKKPVLVVGGGVRCSNGAEDCLKEFVNLTNIPAVSSLQGLDVVTSNSIGFSGLYGLNHCNLALYNADLICVLGCRLSKRQIGIPGKYAKNAKIFQVDINQSELNRVIESENSFNCEIFDFLRECLCIIKHENVSFDFSEWNKEIEEWKFKYLAKTEFNSCGIRPVDFMNNLSKYITSDSNITFDVGQNQMWCAQGLIPKSGQRILSSSGLGCMGFSLPAAVGAYYCNKRETFAFMGDGGFQMNMQELNIISSNHLPIKIFVFNNNSLGMIQEVQMKFSSCNYVGTKIGFNAPNLQGLAEAYGISYKKVTSEKFDNDLSWLMDSDDPVMFEINLSENPTRLMNKYDEQEIYI